MDLPKVASREEWHARGVELLDSSTQFIDLTPLGRQEG